MHALIIGLWRNLGATLPEVDEKLAEREQTILAELAQVRDARQLIGATMAAARIERKEPEGRVLEMAVEAAA